MDDRFYSFWWPVFYAAMYTLFMPLLKNLLFVLYVAYGRLKDQGSIFVSKGSSIPMSKYLDLRQNYETQTSVLEEALKQETGTLTKLYGLQKEKQALELTINNIQKEKIDQEAKIQSLNQFVMQNLTDKNAFQILNAEYGRYDRTIDVTEKISKLLKTDFGIVINNSSLNNGEDPVQDVFKKLKIIYKHKDLIHKFEAWEDEVLKKMPDTLVSEPTEQSLRKKRSEENLPRLHEFFKGEWFLDFKGENKKEGQETVIIDDQGRYFANGEHIFNLLYVEINDTVGSIDFVKRYAKRVGTHSQEKLTFDQKSGEIIGTDSRGFKLRYHKFKN